MLVAAEKHRVYWLVLKHGANAQSVLMRQNGPRHEMRCRDLLSQDRDETRRCTVQRWRWEHFVGDETKTRC